MISYESIGGMVAGRQRWGYQDTPIGGLFDSGGFDWNNALSSVSTTARDVLVAREQRRAIGRGADANSVLAMQPGIRGGGVGSMSGNIGLALGAVALIMFVVLK